MGEERARDIIIEKMQAQNQHLQEENKLLNYKVKSTMEKNERLTKENERLRQLLDESNYEEAVEVMDNEG